MVLVFKHVELQFKVQAALPPSYLGALATPCGRMGVSFRAEWKQCNFSAITTNILILCFIIFVLRAKFKREIDAVFCSAASNLLWKKQKLHSQILQVKFPLLICMNSQKSILTPFPISCMFWKICVMNRKNLTLSTPLCLQHTKKSRILEWKYNTQSNVEGAELKSASKSLLWPIKVFMSRHVCLFKRERV